MIRIDLSEVVCITALRIIIFSKNCTRRTNKNAYICSMDITWDFILRIFVAAMLGGAIGLEREYRAKEAGLRTHFLVAMGSALFMIVSAYGFDGIELGEEQRWDIARIAAQVVTGIGFIGAGTIIFHKSENVIRGLTTAAGVWVTAAIGLACGGGMYILAIVATALVLIGLEVFGLLIRWLTKRSKRKLEEQIKNNRLEKK